MSVISVEQLKFKYQNAKKNAVDGVSFCIEKGAYTAIVGSNGSGKSTLARLLCGLETPLEGSIQVQENQNILKAMDQFIAPIWVQKWKANII